jgi:hypothetical protein
MTPVNGRDDILLIISGSPLDSGVKIGGPREFKQRVSDLAILSRISLAEVTSWSKKVPRWSPVI